MSYTRRSQDTKHATYEGRHTFEHWYRDNQFYFITARCRDKFPAFRSDEAKAIFWDRSDHHTHHYGFASIVTTLVHNHYHTLGQLKLGTNLGPMMRGLHGSVAKLVNDLLDQRRVPFWHDKRHHDYFDGCLRDEKQFRFTYRYVAGQAVRHGLSSRGAIYPHTHINVDCERALARAVELKALLWGVPYKCYQR